MLKSLLLVVTLTLFTSAASLAQTALPAAPAAPAPMERLLPPGQVKEKYKDYLYQRYASDRKALAAVQLFRKRQTGGAIFMAVGGALLGTLIGVQGTHSSSNGGQVTVTVSPLAYIIYPGPFIGVGIGKLSRFSDRRLYEALDGYDRTGTLPNYVQGRLHERDYQ
ncbi:MAG: hypothetical protein EOO62_27885 [Hymenobacter sp.]|nr:MAG: hypothetical protein EOO62_27885 [Hymenobacter sp.]